MNLEIPSIQLRHRSWDSMTHDTCTRLASCCCRKSPAEKAIQVHTGQMSSKTIIIGLSIFRCGNECTSQITEDFASLWKFKTFRRSLNRISTYRGYILFPNLSSSLERRRKRTLGTRSVNTHPESFGSRMLACTRIQACLEKFSTWATSRSLFTYTKWMDMEQLV